MSSSGCLGEAGVLSGRSTSRVSMEDFRGGQNAALVVLTFLQADYRNPEYGKELHSLGREICLARDINANDPLKDGVDDGDLQTDGHQISCVRASLQGLQPSADQPWARNRDEAGLLRVAEELREIADQLERNVMAQATQNLGREISSSPLHQWKDHLTREVDRVMRQGVGLEHLAQERVVVALTLTLVKGVCEQAPHLLRNLFNIALQYVSDGGTR
ncbi:BH3 interacting domain death agonist [Notolabrus celidotus]|uniref:BH3 interacting domain death agonist n=1 Tax=Notolabrus celidotus TaxID=1203425 RepID=UPI00148FD9AE|nr:BH3 interacting domain death agonist [Notolabrus celidotus]